MSIIETRPLADPPEFRSAENGTRIVATGVAMRYGARSKPISKSGRGVFREEFRSGALARSIDHQDVEARFEHNGPFLGRTGSGTLRLTDDRSVVAYELDLPDTTAGRDAAYHLEKRDVGGTSIGFRSLPKAEQWTKDEDGLALRSVGEAKLFYVDLVMTPAYPDSTAELALRSLAEDLGVEVRSLLDATDLAALIAPEEGDETRSDDEQESARETPTAHRQPIASLYL